MVTAQQARQLRQEFLEREAAIQDPKLERTLQTIEEAANRGKQYIVMFNASSKLVDNLKALGYNIGYDEGIGGWVVLWWWHNKHD